MKTVRKAAVAVHIPLSPILNAQSLPRHPRTARVAAAQGARARCANCDLTSGDRH